MKIIVWVYETFFVKKGHQSDVNKATFSIDNIEDDNQS